VIARAHNLCEASSDPTAHAEMLVIREAAKKLDTWYLNGSTLYVTLEPCAMCAGAAINARVSRIVFGAFEPVTGCCGSVADFFAMPFNHTPLSRSGILEEDCRKLLTDFFQQLRNA
jgi:tRNA(adenine34) deaminase